MTPFRLTLTVTAVACAAIVVACGAARSFALPADREAPIRYVALGDSTVAGVGATNQYATYVSRVYGRLREIYPASVAYNLGVPGATSADVVRDQLATAVAHAPALVTVSVGPNDVTQRVPLAQFEANVDALFKRLRRETSAVTVATLLPDLGITPRFRDTPARDAVSRASRTFNDALRRRARAHKVALVDLHGPSLAEVPGNPGLVAADGYHPSDAGYARWAELMWAVIAPLVPAR